MRDTWICEVRRGVRRLAALLDREPDILEDLACPGCGYGDRLDRLDLRDPSPRASEDPVYLYRCGHCGFTFSRDVDASHYKLMVHAAEVNAACVKAQREALRQRGLAEFYDEMVARCKGGA